MKIISIVLAISSLLLFNEAYAQTPVEQWGFIGNRTGGWTVSKGTAGSVTISGANPLTNWAGVRGGFSTFIPNLNEAIVITGVMQFNGAGFDIPVPDAFSSTLRFGVFYTENAGSVAATSSGFEWNGTEGNHSGYLFVPYSGINDHTSWAFTTPATHSCVNNGTWLSTFSSHPTPLGEFKQYPSMARATEGVYNFAISIRPLNEGQQEIRFYLLKSDSSYYFGGVSIDDSTPLTTNKFNCFSFAVFQNNTDILTSLQLYDVKAGYGVPIEIPSMGSAQIDTVNVSGDIYPNTGNLNAAIDTALFSGTLSNTIFKLQSNSKYLLNKTILIPASEQLTITAPDPEKTQLTSPPQILWSSDASINKDYNLNCYGDIALKNIWLLFADRIGVQAPSSIGIRDDPQANASGKGEIAEFDNVIFDYSGAPANFSGAVSVTAKHFKGTIKNCYFRNFTDKYYRYYGRAVSFPYGSSGWHIDSLTFENCTFANIGIVYAQDGHQYADYVKFNHCTFLNTLMSPLQTGWWRNLSLTNCIFTNTWMLGGMSWSEPMGGTIGVDRISDFGFSVPFTETGRHIVFLNSSYGMEPWLLNYFHNITDISNIPVTDKPSPLPLMNESTRQIFNDNFTFPYMVSANLSDLEVPEFVYTPADTEKIKQFLLEKWTGAGELNWAFNPQSSINQIWPLVDDLSYNNYALKTGAMGNFPMGDLYHWWPSEYVLWKEQKEAEDQNIINIMNGDTTIITKAPLFLFPYSGATYNRKDSLTFTWHQVPFVSGYEFQLSLDPSFSNTIITNITSDTSFTFTELQDFTEYFWRVRSYNSLGFSSFSKGSVSILTSSPIAPVPAYPLHEQRALPVDTVTIIWHPVPSALSYDFQFSLDSSFSVLIINDFTSDTIFTITSLQNNTTYYWRVRASNVIGAGEFTENSFTTIALSPAIPVLIAPVNNQHYVKADTLKFVWNSAANALGYKFQLAADSLFTSLTTVKDSLSDTSYTVSSLQNNKKYFWRVISYNMDYPGVFSQSYSFTTIGLSPAVPLLIAPPNNQHYVKTDSLRLVWNSSANALGYKLQLASDSLFTSLTTVKDSLSDTSYTVSSLENNKKYFWRVISYNMDYPGVFSQSYSFTTIVPVPGAPLLVSPANNETDVVLLTAFSWDSSDFAEKYHFQLSADSVFSQLLLDTISVNKNIILTTPLNPNTFYFWHVSSIDTAGESVFSSLSKFKTGVLVSVPETNILPTEFVLSQNYPNPFNPSTNIKYSVPKESYISLKVYNLLGEEVVTLFEGLRQPGNYIVKFENSDLAGGVYLYQFRAESFVETKKFILLK